MKGKLTPRDLYVLARENKVEFWEGAVRVTIELSGRAFIDGPEMLR